MKKNKEKVKDMSIEQEVEVTSFDVGSEVVLPDEYTDMCNDFSAKIADLNRQLGEKRSEYAIHEAQYFKLRVDLENQKNAEIQKAAIELKLPMKTQKWEYRDDKRIFVRTE